MLSLWDECSPYGLAICCNRNSCMKSKHCTCTRGDPRGTPGVPHTWWEVATWPVLRQGGPKPGAQLWGPTLPCFCMLHFSPGGPGSGNSMVSDSSRRYDVTDEVNAWGQPAFQRRWFTCGEMAHGMLLSFRTRGWALTLYSCREMNFQAGLC